MGVATSSWVTNKRLGDDSFSWSLRLYGKHANFEHTGLRHNGSSLPYHDVFPQGTRVGALLDLEAGTLEYVIDGVKKGKRCIFWRPVLSFFFLCRIGVAFNNLKGHVITPVLEFCCTSNYQMNHDAAAPAI